MGRLGRAFNQGALAQEIALDRVGGHEDIGGLGMEVVFSSAQETEAFFGNLEIPGPMLGRCGVVLTVVSGCCTHVCVVCASKAFQNESPKNHYRILNFGKLLDWSAARIQI